MLKTRAIALIGAMIALAAVPASATILSFPPGPTSLIVGCDQSDETIIPLGATQTFELTDVTIANLTALPVGVSIGVVGPTGVEYVAIPDTSVTQKFETPIQFKGPANSVSLFCSSSSSNVAVSIQGVMQ